MSSKFFIIPETPPEYLPQYGTIDAAVYGQNEKDTMNETIGSDFSSSKFFPKIMTTTSAITNNNNSNKKRRNNSFSSVSTIEDDVVLMESNSKIKKIENNKKKTKTTTSSSSQEIASSSSTTSSSLPSLPTCIICMNEMKNETSSIDCCSHKYCFDCIAKWSLVTNTCPLCKIRFRKITKLKSGYAKWVQDKKITESDSEDYEEDFDDEEEESEYDFADGFVVSDDFVEYAEGGYGDEDEDVQEVIPIHDEEEESAIDLTTTTSQPKKRIIIIDTSDDEE